MNIHGARELIIRSINGTRFEGLARKLHGANPFSASAKYDRLSLSILKSVLKENSNCIDAGGYRGEILKQIMRYAPMGRHYCFEPNPANYDFLSHSFSSYPNVTIEQYALGDQSGTAQFSVPRSHPARSSLKLAQEFEADLTQVEVRRLDEVLPRELKIDFIKVDVEGAEYSLFVGAQELLERDKPAILFECDAALAKPFGVDAQQVYDLLCNSLGYSIRTLEEYCQPEASLSFERFKALFDTREEIYFFATAQV